MHGTFYMISVNICYTGSVEINALCNAIVLFVHVHCSDYSSACTREVINTAFPGIPVLELA